MQPYFFPYIGYFQLIDAVDLFVIYDNVEYTKRGWINRNRFLRNGSAAIFSAPLKRASDYLPISERELADSFDRKKLINKLREAYLRAPCFDRVFPLVEKIISNHETNLFRYIQESIRMICDHLEFQTKIVVSSDLEIDHQLRGQSKVLALCRCAGATVYINAIGGMRLYDDDAFNELGIELKFLRSKIVEYNQFSKVFVPWLSIIDVMMFNRPEEFRRNVIGSYELILKGGEDV